jgi:hypothetical protein
VTFDVHGGEVVGARHAVLHERCGEELPRLAVVDHLLHQRLPHALGHAAVDLPLQRERIDHRAHVVDDGVAHQRCRAGLLVDLDLAHVAAVGPGVGGRREGPRLVEAWLDAGR